MIEEQKLDVGIKGWRREDVFVMHFFCSGKLQNVFYISLSDRQGDEETCREGSGHEW